MQKKLHLSSDNDGIFELRMDDAENENRLSEEICEELKITLTELATETAMKALIFTGTKTVFCAGATLGMLNKIARGESLEDLIIPLMMLRLRVPLLAAVEGHAVGAGLVMAMCCDVTVASEASRYGFPFLNLGFTPGMGTTSLLPALVGSTFATEMLMTAKYYKGRDLMGRGLFSHIVPAAEVYGLTRDIARSMVDKPKYVLEMVKDTLTGPRREALEKALVHENKMHDDCFSRPEVWSRITENYFQKS
jgi:polyketide biosynthesis enoyl-CoA hydratase PksI